MFSTNSRDSFVMKAVSIISVLVLVVGVFPAAVSANGGGGNGDTCGRQHTYTIDEDSESAAIFTFSESDDRVEIDFNDTDGSNPTNDDKNQVIVTADTGYEIVSIEWAPESNSSSYTSVSVTNPSTTINTAGTATTTQIDNVRVTVKKAVCVDACGLQFTIETDEDYTDQRVVVDFQSGDDQISIQPQVGYIMVSVHLDIESDNLPDNQNHTNQFPGTFNPNPGNDIEEATIVVKTADCIEITVCHALGNGNWNEVPSSMSGWTNGHSGHIGDFIIDSNNPLCPPDETAPTFGSVSNITEETDDEDGTTVTYSNPAATDNEDDELDVVCTPASNSVFPVGVTTVNCTTEDSSGNEASTSFTVTVTLMDNECPEFGIYPDCMTEEEAQNSCELTTGMHWVDGQCLSESIICDIFEDLDMEQPEYCGEPVDTDADDDTIEDGSDNCPEDYNPGQENTYGTEAGDACETPEGNNDGECVENCDVCEVDCGEENQIPASEPQDATPASTGHVNATCENNQDDDNDGLYDMNDPGCEDDSDTSEENPVGGIGNGEVAGASCGPILNTYLGLRGKENDPEAVKIVQEFLNKELGLSLEVNGEYNEETIEAVKAFQTKYSTDVLGPWGISDSTGIVYLTTQRMINMISCPGLDLPIPELK